jgi:hypothetical protein
VTDQPRYYQPPQPAPQAAPPMPPQQMPQPPGQFQAPPPQYQQPQYQQPQYQQYQQPGAVPQPPYGAQQPQPGSTPKPRKKRGFWAWFFIVLFSPFIALWYFLVGLYWVFLWLMTPVALVFHFIFCAIGLVWYTPVKLLASGRSKYRVLQPRYPMFPPLWTGAYWVRLRQHVRDTCEVGVAIVQIFN